MAAADESFPPSPFILSFGYPRSVLSLLYGFFFFCFPWYCMLEPSALSTFSFAFVCACAHL